MQFPTSTTDMNVYFADSKCDPNTITATTQTISCDLETFPKAGDYTVDVQLVLGRIFVMPSITPISVPLTITGIENFTQPGTTLNQLGGDLIKITGTGFSLKQGETSVLFDDQTSCLIDYSLSIDTEIFCKVSGFDIS